MMSHDVQNRVADIRVSPAENFGIIGIELGERQDVARGRLCRSQSVTVGILLNKVPDAETID